jgi:dihydroxyacetone kinase-like predicted kinase
MMQQLLAKMEEMNANQDKAEVSMNASMKEQMQEMTVLMKADRKTDQARMEANKDDFLARLEARIETNKEKDREDLKKMWEEIISGQAEMRFTTCAFRFEMEESIQREMRALIKPVQSELDETAACNGATETEPDLQMMQPIEAAVVSVVRERKR